MTKHLSKIEKLIAELCPDGVEFKELGDLAEHRNWNKQLNKTAMAEIRRLSSYKRWYKSFWFATMNTIQTTTQLQ